jgi:drug/metabolite transporter (DMT)-like permease
MTVVVWALTSSVCYGIADFLGGLASRRLSAAGVAAATQLIGIVVFVLVFPFIPGRFRIEDIAWGAGSGIAYSGGIVLFYTALARSRMALVSAIAAVVGASVPVLFGYLAGERPPFLASVGVGLGLLAVALLSANSNSNTMDEGRLTLRDPGVAPALASGVGFGLSLLFLSRSSHETGLWALSAAEVAAMVGIGTWTATHRAPFRPDRRLWGLIVSAGVLGTGGAVLFVLAIRDGVLPVVAVLESLYPLSTILLACTLLRERLSPFQWAGVLCAVSGTALIAHS